MEPTVTAAEYGRDVAYAVTTGRHSLLPVGPQVGHEVAIENATFDKSRVALIYNSDVVHAAHEYTNAVFDVIQSGVSSMSPRDGEKRFLLGIGVQNLAGRQHWPK